MSVKYVVNCEGYSLEWHASLSCSQNGLGAQTPAQPSVCRTGVLPHLHAQASQVSPAKLHANEGVLHSYPPVANPRECLPASRVGGLTCIELVAL